ncbi:MAG: DUF362 domain-containing protein [Thermodesulfobacteriota bacterium]
MGDGSGQPWVPTERTFQNAEFSSKMTEMKIPLLAFDRSQYLDVAIGGEFLDLIAYPRDLENLDKIVYLPVMKTHFLAGFSMSLKLTVGFVHLVDRTILHGENNLFVSQRAAEMNIPVKPDLIITDGRVSFVSAGPAIRLAFILGLSWPLAIQSPWTCRASVSSSIILPSTTSSPMAGACSRSRPP